MKVSNSALSEKGIALPMTIIAIGGLLTLLVGLLTVLTLERKTARSYSNTTRADLAVESGLAAALADISSIVIRDDSLVFRLDDPTQAQVTSADRPLGFREQFFTYGAIFENNTWQVIPLFSNSPPATLGNREIETTSLKSELINYIANAQTLGRITEHDQNIPRATWTEIPADSSDEEDYPIRYAYWVEDMGGLLPGDTIATEPRAEGLSTTELDPSTIFEPTAETGLLPVTMDEKRDTLRTTGSLRQFLTAEQAKRIEPYIHYLPSSQEAQTPIIPQGFGYSDAGLPAPDLNTFVTDADVDGIADQINRNLPLFHDRKGGFPASEDYVKTIAASIIDYVDTDNDATIGIGYRGVDSYPFVNELFDRYEWIASPPGTVSIDVDTYIELWNPSDKEIEGTITFNNINKRKIKLGGNGTKDFTPATFGPIVTTIPPNGFRVIPLGKQNYSFDVDIEPAEPLTFNEDDSESSFELLWNGALVDYPRGGVERTYSLLRSGLSQRRWKGNSSPLLDTSSDQFGDPRASFYLNDFFQKSDYGENSNWGGRVIKRNLAKGLPYREVRLEKWPDRSSNSTLGIDAGTDARVPTDSRIILKSTGAPIAGKEFPANQPELAPARISNSGEYFSLGELGNIFDPAQWQNVDNASFAASSVAGGGITLAIGRPEYAAFDQDGLRAAQLLDLFSLKRDPAPLYNPININTAPREVLRTLIANIVLDEDPIATDLEIAKDADAPTIGDIFADHVIAYRNFSPLRSISDLNLIRENPDNDRDYNSPHGHPFFGNTQNYVNVPTIAERVDPSLEYDQTDYEEWNDSGREELLRKVMELVSYRSNIFRIVVSGEVLDPDGKAISRSTREYHVGIYPERDPAGLIVPGGKITIRKYYESSR